MQDCVPMLLSPSSYSMVAIPPLALIIRPIRPFFCALRPIRSGRWRRSCATALALYDFQNSKASSDKDTAGASFFPDVASIDWYIAVAIPRRRYFGRTSDPRMHHRPLESCQAVAIPTTRFPTFATAVQSRGDSMVTHCFFDISFP